MPPKRTRKKPETSISTRLEEPSTKEIGSIEIVEAVKTHLTEDVESITKIPGLDMDRFRERVTAHAASGLERETEDLFSHFLTTADKAKEEDLAAEWLSENREPDSWPPTAGASAKRTDNGASASDDEPGTEEDAGDGPNHGSIFGVSPDTVTDLPFVAALKRKDPNARNTGSSSNQGGSRASNN